MKEVKGEVDRKGDERQGRGKEKGKKINKIEKKRNFFFKLTPHIVYLTQRFYSNLARSLIGNESFFFD